MKIYGEDGEVGFLAKLFTTREQFQSMHLVYSSVCATYPDALEVGIHVIDDGFGACVESQNMDSDASAAFSDWAEAVPWFAVTRVTMVRAPWFFRLVWPLMRRLNTSPMPNSVPRGQTLEDLMVIESLEQLHKRVDLECLPLALEGIFSQTYGSLLTVTLHINIVPCVYLRMRRGLRRAGLHGGDTVACVLLLNGSPRVMGFGPARLHANCH